MGEGGERVGIDAMFPVPPDERVANVTVTDDELIVVLRDGRRICAPLSWYPRLLNATAKQRKKWRLARTGLEIHWGDFDEHVNTGNLLRGMPSAEALNVDHIKRFKVGDRVSFERGMKSVQGVVQEDRGPLGIGGRHLYGIEFHIGLEDEPSRYVELPAIDLELVE